MLLSSALPAARNPAEPVPGPAKRPSCPRPPARASEPACRRAVSESGGAEWLRSGRRRRIPDKSEANLSLSLCLALTLSLSFSLCLARSQSLRVSGFSRPSQLPPSPSASLSLPPSPSVSLFLSLSPYRHIRHSMAALRKHKPVTAASTWLGPPGRFLPCSQAAAGSESARERPAARAGRRRGDYGRSSPAAAADQPPPRGYGMAAAL